MAGELVQPPSVRIIRTSEAAAQLVERVVSAGVVAADLLFGSRTPLKFACG